VNQQRKRSFSVVFCRGRVVKNVVLSTAVADEFKTHGKCQNIQESC
jgi:hypothetical protein